MAEESNFLISPLSAASSGPLYQQIVDGLKKEISEGRLKSGAPLPSFRQLAEDMMVSVITVKRAYEELEKEGIILRRQGLGTFVAPDGEDKSREAKLHSAEELIRSAIVHATEAGFSKKEIQDLLRTLLEEKKK